jgi:hypothetical protein
MTNNVRWVCNISKDHVYIQCDTVQSHAEMLEHPYKGQGDLVHVSCAQLLFANKNKGQQSFISFFIL